MGLLIAGHAFGNDIEELSWLTGTWVGQLGDIELEETWNQPKAGSVQAVARMRSGEQMLMVEMIVIDEHEDSFRLRLQQWDPGMEPRAAGRQSMKLTELGEKKASFEAEDEGPLKSVSYHRKSETEFEITVVSDKDETHKIELTSASEADSNEDAPNATKQKPDNGATSP